MKSRSSAALQSILGLAFTIVAQTTVQQWHPTDLSFTSATSHANQFKSVTMSATFTGPGSTALTIPAFHNGGTTWIVRFSPIKIGSWSYTTTSNDANLNGQTGTITCIANTNAKVHGKLSVDPANPHHFVYEDGTKYFLMGAETDWLGLMNFSDANIAAEKQLIDMYAANGFTQVMMDYYAVDPTWSEDAADGPYDFGPPQMSPWGADKSHLNTAFYNHYDKVIDYLFQKGIVAHIYYQVYTKQVSYPSNNDVPSSDDSLFFNYFTARYQAYPNMFWDMAKEAGTTGNKSDAYATNHIQLIKSKDAYHRLVSIHDGSGFYDNSSINALADFRTDQTHDTYYGTIIDERNAKNWPIYNAEYEYEWGAGGSGDYAYPVVQSPQSVMKATYEVVMAGGYPCYYYTNHSWDIVKYSEVPAGIPYYKHLTDFFTRARWYDLIPTDNLLSNASGKHCLSAAGTEYIVYFSNGGATNLTVAGASGQLLATWMNAYTGAEQSGTAAANGTYATASPWANTPSLLWLHVNASSATGGPAYRDLARWDQKKVALYDISGRRIGSYAAGRGAAPISMSHGVYLAGSGKDLKRAIHPVR